MTTRALNHILTRDPAMDLDNQVGLFLFNAGVSRGALAWQLLADLPDGQVELHFEGPEEDVWDLARHLGIELDAEVFQPADGKCQHPDTSSNDDGSWSCDECGEEVTADTLDRLIGTIQDYLSQAAKEQAGTHGQASAVLRAAHWMHVAERAASNITSRTGFGKPERI